MFSTCKRSRRYRIHRTCTRPHLLRRVDITGKHGGGGLGREHGAIPFSFQETGFAPTSDGRLTAVEKALAETTALLRTIQRQTSTTTTPAVSTASTTGAAASDLAVLAAATAEVAVAANKKEQLAKSVLERGVRLLPATSAATRDARPSTQRGYDAYVQDPLVAAVIQVRGDGKPAVVAAATTVGGLQNTLQIRADRLVPEEVAVLDNEGLRMLDNAVATSHVAAHLGAKGVAMPPPTIAAAAGEESLRFTIPRLGTPIEGDPSLARTMAIFDPKSGAKNLALSGAEFSRLHDTVMRKFSSLDRHTRIAMTELLRELRAGSSDGTLSQSVTAVCTHMIEVTRQHKLILGHETAIALGMVRPPSATTVVPPMFPINAAIANASTTSADDDLRKHALKRDLPEGEESGEKRAKTGNGSAAPHRTHGGGGGGARPKPVSPGGGTAGVTPATGAPRPAGPHVPHGVGAHATAPTPTRTGGTDGRPAAPPAESHGGGGQPRG